MFIDETRTITFNPEIGLRNRNGQIQSSSLGLGHEMDHAAHFDRDPVQHRADDDVVGLGVEVVNGEVIFKYRDSVEEARATANETEMAKELGEPTRKKDSEGTEVPVPTPTFSCTRCP